MKKIITTLMIVMILVSCLVPCAFADYEEEYFGNEIIEPRYEVLNNVTISFIISNSGRSDFSATVLVPSGYRVDLTAELQQKSGSSWNTIHDWEASGKNYITVSGPWYVLPGYSYRIKVTATVYDSSGNFVEAPVEYSKVQEY